ncbi:predicted protein [Plenodomus lingam JN3]|uniref:Predicted protein n=1 Tax=Leptosphaeria maculans (strain JN3 / isolate v23.1.3 / race Av1-4-5-6-7-8) TaxID=985895 RepID=E5ACJ7_LEPMJ|nr:predicted protein [Plenodomus lingam JN3]CBY02199.1 predicted protein [Plenodomus lingam JN3]
MQQCMTGRNSVGWMRGTLHEHEQEGKQQYPSTTGTGSKCSVIVIVSALACP